MPPYIRSTSSAAERPLKRLGIEIAHKLFDALRSTQFDDKHGVNLRGQSRVVCTILCLGCYEKVHMRDRQTSTRWSTPAQTGPLRSIHVQRFETTVHKQITRSRFTSKDGCRVKISWASDPQNTSFDQFVQSTSWGRHASSWYNQEAPVPRDGNIDSQTIHQ